MTRQEMRSHEHWGVGGFLRMIESLAISSWRYFSLAVVFAILAPIALADRHGDRLVGDQFLEGRRSDYLGSTGDTFRLVMQTDCNLVLYYGSRALWNAGSEGKGTDCIAKMQTDGNFVVYNNRGQAVWNSGTQGHPGAYVILQDDGNLVVYRANQAPNPQGQGHLWATMTVTNIPTPTPSPTGAAQRLGW